MSDKIKIGGIIEQKDMSMFSLLSLPDRPGIAGEIFNILASREINLEYITESRNAAGKCDIIFCVNEKYADETEKIMRPYSSHLRFETFTRNDGIGLIGIYGPHFREKPGIASSLAATLGLADINILGISTSISTMCCLIRQTHFERAKNILLSRFELP